MGPSDGGIMVRVRRMVRRSLTIAVLGAVVATILAIPDAPADDGTTAASKSNVPTAAAVANPAVFVADPVQTLLGDQAEELLVGHADVLRLYWAFFGRDPDADGARYWIDLFDQGASIDAIAFSFSGSEEFNAKYGVTSNEEFVRIVYGNVLQRTPDPQGYRYWVELLDEPSVRRVDVVRWISASSEFINAHPYRSPSLRNAMGGSVDMTRAVEAVEAIVGGRPAASLPEDRSPSLVAAIDLLNKRFGRFSTVTADGCQGGDCRLSISEVGLAQDLTVTLADGVVAEIRFDDTADAWAADAVRTAVTGREVFGSRGLTDGARKTLASNVRRITPTTGALGRSNASFDSCENSLIQSSEPGGSDVARRACGFVVAGPVHFVLVEAVTHNGVFAGINVEVPSQYTETAYEPYATIGDVVLHHPAHRVERIGYHESGHDGARQHERLDIDTVTTTMASRNRGTGSRTAADIAVHPDDEIRSPVTGTVKRAGSYTLYCQYRDHYLVIEPDARPGYEVKVLHFEGLAVETGDRVVAGETVVGSAVRMLPFVSQIDKSTADPSNGHIHIEVVDISIPDRPSGGGC